MINQSNPQPPSGGTWQALQYFNLYRVVLALLLLALLIAGWAPQPFPIADTGQFMALALLYLCGTLAAVLCAHYRIGTLMVLGVSGVCLDVLLLGLMHYCSGGVGSGFDVLLLVSVAGHSILAGGGIVFFYAALATLAVLGAESYLHLVSLPGIANFSFAGFFSLSLFVIAYGCRLLAERLAQSETLVHRRARELQELTRLNERIVGMMQAGVVAIDERGQVSLLNPAARRILGRTTGGRGRPLRELAPELAERLRDLMPSAPASRPPPRPASESAPEPEPEPPGVAHLQLGGHEYQVTGLRLGAAEQGCLLVLEESATVRSRALQLKRTALSRLAAGIAHELRNPLAAITQAAQLLDGAETLPEQARRLAHVIDRQGQRMNRIVENVLQLSRPSPPHRELLRLKTWLAEFRQEFTDVHHLDESEMQVSVRPATLVVHADPTQLHQVLWNLSENALRYSSRTPRLRLCAGREPVTGRVCLDVIDRGGGIDREHARRLFEPFFTTEADGSGLGLYLANELCETNHAMLSLHRNSPQGCCFRIGFPTPQPRQSFAEEAVHARTGR